MINNRKNIYFEVPKKKVIGEYKGIYTILFPEFGSWIRTNKMGKEIIDLCNRKRPVKEIIEMLARVNNLPPKDIKEDVIDFIEEFKYLNQVKNKSNWIKFIIKSVNQDFVSINNFVNSFNISNHHFIYIIESSSDLGNVKKFSDSWKRRDRIGIWTPNLNFDFSNIPSRINEIYLDLRELLEQNNYIFLENQVHNILNSSNIPVWLIFYINRLNKKEIYKYLDIAEKNNSLGVSLMRYIPFSDHDKRFQLSEKEYTELLFQIILYTQKKKAKIMLDYPLCHKKFDLSTVKNNCGAGKNIFYISSNGEVFPCPYLVSEEFAMGNIKKINDYFLNCTVDALPICNNCNYRFLCGGGCRASAFINSGRIDGGDPYCKSLQKIFNFTLFGDNRTSKVEIKTN